MAATPTVPSVALVLVILMLSSFYLVSATCTSAEAEENADLSSMAAACGPDIVERMIPCLPAARRNPVPPTNQCCALIHSVSAGCLCVSVQSSLAKMEGVDLVTALELPHKCKLHVPAGTKCAEKSCSTFFLLQPDCKRTVPGTSAFCRFSFKDYPLGNQDLAQGMPKWLPGAGHLSKGRCAGQDNYSQPLLRLDEKLSRNDEQEENVIKCVLVKKINRLPYYNLGFEKANLSSEMSTYIGPLSDPLNAAGMIVNGEEPANESCAKHT